MSTARDLIKDALMDIGVIASGETPSASESQDALRVFNRMLGRWSLKSLLVNKITIETFTLNTNQSSYSIGSLADFDTSRPTQILKANIKDINGHEYPLEIINYQQWSEITLKSLSSSLPCKLYFEPTAPNGMIHLYPVPSESKELVLYSLKPLTKISDIDEEVNLPDGYEDAIVSNLAVRLATQFGRVVPPEVKEIAVLSLLAIKNNNSRPVLAKSDISQVSQARGRYNILTGGSY